MEYIGKIAVYQEPNDKYKWLVKITNAEHKRCKNDWFKHLYFSGYAVLIDEMKKEMTPLPEYRTGISNFRRKDIEEFIDPNRKELTSLFEK